ncbi:MAG: WxcM-like domain-containing protein [Victivallaceae bacterium]|nr:WxcM-like domain-containing protein [Victivallaceae bacterium]
MHLRVQKHSKIITQTFDKQKNGFLIPIFNIHDNFIDPAHMPKQVYLTVVSPKMVKGPHLHKKRRGLFSCIRGNIKVVVQINGKYEEYFSGENYNFASIEVPAGVPAALQNIGDIDAYVLNMPSPAWHIDDQDEHPVDNWNYEFNLSPAT